MSDVRNELGLSPGRGDGRGLSGTDPVLPLVFTTLCEVDDIADLSAALATRAPHEAVTRQVRDILRQFSPDVLTLSTESCAICEHCAYPDAPCRHPERMFPCVESYGIVATALAEQNGIEFYNSNIVTWFSLLCYR